MQNNQTFHTRVVGGCIQKYTRERIADFLRSLEGKLVEIKISIPKNKRTQKQNSFYWGVVIPFVTSFFQEYGNDFDQMQVHEYLKSEVGKMDTIVKLPTGVARISGSTQKMSTKEFEDYITKIRAWGAEWGLSIPFPREGL